MAETATGREKKAPQGDFFAWQDAPRLPEGYRDCVELISVVLIYLKRLKALENRHRK